MIFRLVVGASGGLQPRGVAEPPFAPGLDESGLGTHARGSLSGGDGWSWRWSTDDGVLWRGVGLLSAGTLTSR